MACITCDATLDNVAKVMSFLRERLSGTTVELRSVELVVEEILMNVIQYAYLGAQADSSDARHVEVALSIAREKGVGYLVVRFRDWGMPFNPFEDAPRPDTTSCLTERPVGGLGIHLVKKFCPRYAYSGTDGVNLTELYFPLCSRTS